MFLAIAFIAGGWGCVKEVKPLPKVPPNVQGFRDDIRTIWFTLMKVMTREFGLPMRVADIKSYYFATRPVYDTVNLQKVRYTLSGSIKFDGTENVVMIYKQIEVFNGTKWEAVPTDYQLERAILNRLSQKLAERRTYRRHKKSRRR